MQTCNESSYESKKEKIKSKGGKETNFIFIRSRVDKRIDSSIDKNRFCRFLIDTQVPRTTPYPLKHLSTNNRYY